MITGRCYEFSSSPPYGPWLEVLDDLRAHNVSPESGRHISWRDIETSALDRHEIFTRIFELLESGASNQPLVLVLEDMHWADNASIELLQAMCRRVPRNRILLVVTYRHDNLDRGNPLYRLLPYLLRDGGAERIHLQRLGQESTNEIIARRYNLDERDRMRLVEHLQARADGNPFFTIELLYALEEKGFLRQTDGSWQFEGIGGIEDRQPLPDLVQQVIDGRLEQLGSQPRHLLEVAAIIGQDIPINLWRTLSDVNEHEFSAGVERAIEAHFIHETTSGRAFSFSHALVHEALYSSIVLPERMRLHRLAAEALLQDHEPEANRVAYHLARAMDQRAVEWLARAGEHALSVYAPQAAVEHCDRALELARELAVDVPQRIFRTRGSAYAMIGRFLRAQQDFTSFLELSRTAGDRRGAWQALQDLGQLWAAKDYGRTRQFFDEALDLARSIGDGQLIAHSLNRVGNWYLNDDRPVEAIRFHNEALQIFSKSGDRRAVAQTTDLLGMDHLIRGDLLNAERILKDAIDEFTALGDRVGLCSALSTYSITAGSHGFEHEIPAQVTPDAIESAMSRATSLSKDMHWRAGEAYAACVAGGYRAVRGHFDLAIASLEHAVAISEEIEHREWMAYALDNLAGVHLSLLATEQARLYAERALAHATRVASRVHERAARTSLARSYLYDGDSETAINILSPACNPQGSIESSIERSGCLTYAMAVLMEGEAEQALDIVERVMSIRFESGRHQVAPRCARVKATTLTALGRHHEAEMALLAARDAALDLGYRPELSEIWLDLGTLYLKSTRPGDASRCFSEARSVIASLADSIPDSTRRDSFLESALARIPDQRGLSPFRAAKQQAGGLTPRQRDVAVLVVQGLSNRAIAEALSISERTVEGHVSAIMTVLDFTSRAQIAAWAVSQGLTQLNT
jgi:DNA-binding CsgD family transcriptional regulator